MVATFRWTAALAAAVLFSSTGCSLMPSSANPFQDLSGRQAPAAATVPASSFAQQPVSPAIGNYTDVAPASHSTFFRRARNCTTLG